MLAILHCADLHLEASFASSHLPAAVGSRRRADLRATLSRILALARERQVDAVTIAGDLFEQEYAAPDTADFLREQFAGLAPIRVFISPGERDPYSHDSLYALTRWSENVSIFASGQPAPLELAPNIHLWGAAPPPGPLAGALDGLRVDRPGINLLLLHAVPAGEAAPGDRGLFQVEEAALRAAGFDLALLGHLHNGRIWPDGHACCVYPGSPEPLSPMEAEGDHQVVLVTIENGSCTPQGIPISQWRYLDLSVDISGCTSTDEVAALVRVSLRHTLGGDDRAVCRIALIGVRRFHLDMAELKGQVDTGAHLHYATRLPAAYDLEQLAYEPTVRGQLVRRFQDRLANVASEAERAADMAALTLALRTLEGRQVRSYESG